MPSRPYLTEAEQRTIIEPIALQIAEHLDGAWTTRDRLGGPSNTYVGTFLIGPDGETIAIDLGDVGRLCIKGFAPDPRLIDHFKVVSIGVSDSRPPAQLAREITRRLLPDYRTNLSTAKEKAQKLDDDHAARTALAEQVLKTLPGSRIGYHNNKNQHTDIYRYSHGGSASVNISLDRDGSGARELKITSLPAEQLLAILTVIAPNKESQP